MYVYTCTLHVLECTSTCTYHSNIVQYNSIYVHHCINYTLLGSILTVEVRKGREGREGREGKGREGKEGKERVRRVISIKRVKIARRHGHSPAN